MQGLMAIFVVFQLISVYGKIVEQIHPKEV